MNSNDRPTKRFLAEYFHDGAWWSVDVYAYDFEDAEDALPQTELEVVRRARDDNPSNGRVVAQFDYSIQERIESKLIFEVAVAL